jgi:hypothetical protein
VLMEAAERPALEALPVRVDGIVDGTAVGLRIAAGDVVDTVVFGSTTLGMDAGTDMPLRRASATAGDLVTDAALLWCRAETAGPEKRVAIVDGRDVRTVDGRVLVSLGAPLPFKETVA